MLAMTLLLIDFTLLPVSAIALVVLLVVYAARVGVARGRARGAPRRRGA